MKIIITEQQFGLLNEQSTLLNILNSTSFISNLVLVVLTVTRGFNAFSEMKFSEEKLQKIQSLVKQSLAGGKTNLTEEEMESIRGQQRIILNEVAKNVGYNNWSEFKEIKIKELNKKIKKAHNNETPHR